ncbi:KTSC domain-containing protein [Rhizobium sp. BK251]|nr:KTSC domain-containing protein [Rhizobium sp. BK251]
MVASDAGENRRLELKPLKSTLIEAIAYDRDSRRLTVYFMDGHVGQFLHVPEGVVLGLELAASPGSFYVSEIRDKYERA